MSHDAQRRPHSEFDLITRIRSALGDDAKHEKPRVPLGIGDDAAIVCSPHRPLLLCSDAMVENTHFKLDWSSPEDLGHKALASCLSDIAAMNGEPLYALVSLALRPGLSEDFVESLYRGLGAVARRHGVSVVGGDLVSSRNEVFIDVTLVGATDRPVTRSGARPGNLVAVTGNLGSAAAALAALEAGRSPASIDPEILASFLRPEPRFDALTTLQSPGLLTSLIDISDGLSSELHHLADRSACGFEIDEWRVPIDRRAMELARELGTESLDWAWNGGEDYQLLMTLEESLWSTRSTGTPGLTIIGRVVEREAGLISRAHPGADARPIAARGWNHVITSR